MALINNSVITKIAGELLLPQVATAGIELMINKSLDLNQNKALSINKLDQKTLTLKLAELSFSLCFTVSAQSKSTTNNGVVIVRAEAGSSDCTINTSLKTLKKLKANQSLTQLIKDDELALAGDIKIAQQFANVAQSLEIDWQSEIAKHLGDVPTHKLLHFGNKMTKSIIATGKQFESDVSEYLVHEQRLLVTKSQIDNFNQKSKEVAKKVDQLSTRINKLFSTVENSAF